MARYETLLEAKIGNQDGGYSVVQVVTESKSRENELRFCYYNEDGRFTNRPLTLRPDEPLLERTSELVENLGYVARTLQPEEIAELVDILGERRVIELAQLIDTLGESRLAEMLSDDSD